MISIATAEETTGLSADGWTWAYRSAVTRDGWRWIVDAHREGRRYLVHSDEPLSAFLELEQTLPLLRN